MANSISDIIGSMYSPSTLQENAVKQELDVQPRKEINLNKVYILDNISRIRCILDNINFLIIFHYTYNIYIYITYIYLFLL